MKHKGKDTREADHLIPAPGPDPIATAEVPVVEAGDVRIGRPRTMNALAALVFLCLSAERAAAQSHHPSAAESAIVAPGPQYAKRGVWTAFAGEHYRNLWVTPIRVPVLDLQRFAGGLTPLRAHTGSQTKSHSIRGRRRARVPVPLGRQGSDGVARPRDPGLGLRDGRCATASARRSPRRRWWPTALLEAAGVLAEPQSLALMPDDPAPRGVPFGVQGSAGPHRGTARRSVTKRTGPAGGPRRVISPTRALFAGRRQPGGPGGRPGISARPAGGHLHGRSRPPPRPVPVGRIWRRSCRPCGSRSRATTMRRSSTSTASPSAFAGSTTRRW